LIGAIICEPQVGRIVAIAGLGVAWGETPPPDARVVGVEHVLKSHGREVLKPQQILKSRPLRRSIA